MFVVCFELYADHRDLHVLPHSIPLRRSSDLGCTWPKFSMVSHMPSAGARARILLHTIWLFCADMLTCPCGASNSTLLSAGMTISTLVLPAFSTASEYSQTASYVASPMALMGFFGPNLFS